MLKVSQGASGFSARTHTYVIIRLICCGMCCGTVCSPRIRCKWCTRADTPAHIQGQAKPTHLRRCVWDHLGHMRSRLTGRRERSPSASRDWSHVEGSRRGACVRIPSTVGIHGLLIRSASDRCRRTGIGTRKRGVDASAAARPSTPAPPLGEVVFWN